LCRTVRRDPRSAAFLKNLFRPLFLDEDEFNKAVCDYEERERFSR
jgi:hypothetical protein